MELVGPVGSGDGGVVVVAGGGAVGLCAGDCVWCFVFGDGGVAAVGRLGGAIAPLVVDGGPSSSSALLQGQEDGHHFAALGPLPDGEFAPDRLEQVFGDM